MAIPNPNPNIADGIKCDNKTYSSNKIESLITDLEAEDITSDVTFIEGITKNYGHVTRTGNLVKVNLVLEVATNVANNSPIVGGLPKAFAESRELLGTSTTQYIPANLTSQAAFITVGSSASGISIMGSITASAESKVYAFLYFTYITD